MQLQTRPRTAMCRQRARNCGAAARIRGGNDAADESKERADSRGWRVRRRVCCWRTGRRPRCTPRWAAAPPHAERHCWSILRPTELLSRVPGAAHRSACMRPIGGFKHESRTCAISSAPSVVHNTYTNTGVRRARTVWGLPGGRTGHQALPNEQVWRDPGRLCVSPTKLFPRGEATEAKVLKCYRLYISVFKCIVFFFCSSE